MNDISNKETKYGRAVRMSIRLRKSLRREPTLKEVLDLTKKCQESPQTYETVSRQQVERALKKGEEVRQFTHIPSPLAINCFVVAGSANIRSRVCWL